MKPFILPVSVLALSLAAPALAGGINMDDPNRALGREDNVRIDAQLVGPTVAAGSPIGVVYQIQNLSSEPVAIADRHTDASYDEDSRTITLSFGSEVPPDGNLPHLVVVQPGEKKVLKGSANPGISGPAVRLGPPRFVRIKVAILRHLQPFASLIARQQPRVTQPLPDDLFEKWFESNDTIVLNALPVQWNPGRTSDNDAENRGRGTF